MSNPILMGEAEKNFDLYMLQQSIQSHLIKINELLPDTYTSITLICRTDKDGQQIVLSNKYDVEKDIAAYREAKR